MPKIELRGSLNENLFGIKVSYLGGTTNYGVHPDSTYNGQTVDFINYYSGANYISSLTGPYIALPSSGSLFLTGVVTSFRLSIATFVGGFSSEIVLKVSDVSLELAKLFELIERTDTESVGQFKDTYFREYLNSEDWTITGGDSDDTIIPGDWMLLAGNDILGGFDGDDLIAGGRGRDRITGGAGADNLLGGSGRDRLAGGAGDDLLKGGQHNDKLFANKGEDILVGGGGADLFVFKGAVNENKNVIRDFNDGQDLIRIEGVEFADITLTGSGRGGVNTKIILESGTEILLKGVTEDLIAIDDFQLG